MEKYFVTNEIRKERLDICKKCLHFFKPTGNCKKCGCFMRVKTSLSFTECPIGLWESTKEIEQPKEEPKHISAIELYNTIYGTNYKTTSNCSSCLNSVWNGIISIYEKNK